MTDRAMFNLPALPQGAEGNARTGTTLIKPFLMAGAAA